MRFVVMSLVAFRDRKSYLFRRRERSGFFLRSEWTRVHFGIAL